MKTRIAALIATTFIAICGMHAAPVILPATYQGRLLDGTNVANGQYEIRFGLFPTATGGTELQAMTNTVTVADGLFTTTLELDRDLIPDPSSGDRWLEIGVRPDGSASVFTLLSARQQLTFSPYAIRASIATLAENLPANSVSGINIQNGAITADKLVDGAGSGLDADFLDGMDSSVFATASHDHYGETWSGAATSGLRVETSATGASGVAALRGSQGSGGGVSPVPPTGVWGESESGFGVFGASASNTGVYGSSPSFIGVSGFGGAIGVLGRSDASDGKGVWGQAPSPNGTTYGVQGTAYSPDGTGIWGEHTSTSGTTAGVLGETDSTSGSAAGVIGHVTSTSPGGYSAGVRGINEGTGSNGIGVYGSQNGSGWGVYGTSVNGYGVYASSGSGNAIYANGAVDADRLVYNSPRTHYRAVAGDLFMPRTFDSTTSYHSAVGSGGAYLSSGTEVLMHAPLNLPDGAVVTTLQAYFYDSSTQTLTARIRRYSPAGFYSSVASADSTGISGAGDKSVAVLGSAATIQNDTYFYTLEAVSSGLWSAAGSNLKIRGVIVGYTISEAE